MVRVCFEDDRIVPPVCLLWVRRRLAIKAFDELLEIHHARRLLLVCSSCSYLLSFLVCRCITGCFLVEVSCLLGQTRIQLLIRVEVYFDASLWGRRAAYAHLIVQLLMQSVHLLFELVDLRILNSQNWTVVFRGHFRAFWSKCSSHDWLETVSQCHEHLLTIAVNLHIGDSLQALHECSCPFFLLRLGVLGNDKLLVQSIWSVFK